MSDETIVFFMGGTGVYSEEIIWVGEWRHLSHDELMALGGNS